MATVADLLNDLRKARDVYAWTRLTWEDGAWRDHSIRLHKTALVEHLKKIDPAVEVRPYAVREDNYTDVYGTARCIRTFYIGETP